MKVLHVVPGFYPAISLGGPIFSTKAICDGLSLTSDIEIKVLTTDTADTKSSERLSPEDIQCASEFGYPVEYCRKNFLSSTSFEFLLKLRTWIAWSDVVHLTGVYSFTTIPTLIAARLARKPVVWSTRGAILATQEWSEAPNRKPKHLFERVCLALLPKTAVTHSTSEPELKANTRRIRGVRSALIPNSIEIPQLEKKGKQSTSERSVELMFLSRIHPKKGLDQAIDALGLLPDHYVLNIYGSGDDDYVTHLKTRVNNLGFEPRVRFHGQVSGRKKTLAFCQADIFVLPTHSENFGIVIAEAMAHGLPVVTTKYAPWPAIQSHNLGRWIDGHPGSIAEALLELESEDLIEMGRRSESYVREHFSRRAETRAFIELYKSILRPDTNIPKAATS